MYEGLTKTYLHRLEKIAPVTAQYIEQIYAHFGAKIAFQAVFSLFLAEKHYQRFHCLPNALFLISLDEMPLSDQQWMFQVLENAKRSFSEEMGALSLT